jgi:hypothetical protein
MTSVGSDTMDTKGKIQIYVLGSLAEDRDGPDPEIENWVFQTRFSHETSGKTMRYWACCYQAAPKIVCCVMRVSDLYFWLGYLVDVARCDEVPLEIRDKLAEAIKAN